jgi:hypothetical protein
MQKTDAKTLQRRIAQHPSITQTNLFYVEDGRVYTWEDQYDPSTTSGFGVEIEAGYDGLSSDVVNIITEEPVKLQNSLVHAGRFRIIS